MRYNHCAMLLKSLASLLQRNCRLDVNQPVLVGVSGGADSLCLLDILNRLRYPVVVAHFNHGLRPEADADARGVRLIAENRNLPFTLGSEDVAAFAAGLSLSIEEAARITRYRFLFAQARKLNAQAVAVGHNADDQVETVLMHLLRGAGLSGLKGMSPRMLPNPWSQDIPLVRPLLSVWRDEISAYCDERGLSPIFDRSNLDTTFFRNRLRHELIPTLDDYVPGVRRRIWHTAQILAGDHAVLEQVVTGAWEACVVEQGTGHVAFAPDSLAAQPLGVQRRLMRRAIGELRPGLRDVDFDIVAWVLEFLACPTSTRQRDLALGLRLFYEGGRLYLVLWEADLPRSNWPQIPAGEVLSLAVPGEILLGGGWRLRAEVVAASDSIRAEARGNENPYQVWLDFGDQQPTLHLRTRLPGDRFQPLGMGCRSTKLSDFMINVKIPRRARAGWPLVCAWNEIAWLPGFRLAHPFRLTGNTRRAVHLRLSRD
ncbi:MAG: tRNA lysidine(34) synthetase TilS [Chloroflexota bacterium]